MKSISHTCAKTPRVRTSVRGRKMPVQSARTAIPVKLIHRELRNDGNQLEDITSHDIDCIRKNMYRTRQAQLPRMPKSQEEVFDCVNKLDLVTNKEEPFLQVSDEANRIIIISCYTN
jgi:hypothetical protein